MAISILYFKLYIKFPGANENSVETLIDKVKDQSYIKLELNTKYPYTIQDWYVSVIRHIKHNVVEIIEF